jgi:Invasion associated locus B (IalB) protein
VRAARQPARNDPGSLSRVRRVTGTILVGLVLATAVFSAQEPDRGMAEGNWLVECPMRTCDVVLAVTGVDPEHGQGFIYRPESNVFLAVGLPAPMRATVSVDRRTPYDFAMCTGLACLLRGREAASLLREMQQGQTLRLEFQGTGGNAAGTQVSLSGFRRRHAEALDRLASTRPALP